MAPCGIAKFGDAWVQNLTRNLRPSPVKELAARYGVSVKHVQEIKQWFWHVGILAQSLAEAGDLTGNPQPTPEEPQPQ